MFSLNRLFLAAVVLVVGSIAYGEDPAPKPMAADAVITVAAPLVPAGEVKLVDRDSLRAPVGTKRVAIDEPYRVFKATSTSATWDWSKNETIPAPMYANNKYGICYPSAAAKLFTFLNANATGLDVKFDEDELVKWYLQTSVDRSGRHGDFGMNDSQMFPAMTKGYIPPFGKHTILDRAIVSATDDAAVATMAADYGPMVLTFTVFQSMMANARPGAIWDVNGGKKIGGHAVLYNGKDAKGNALETWACRPRIRMTDRCLQTCDPEIISFFSLEWFDPKTGLAPNGKHYLELAAQWTRFTGTPLPPNPFPPPVAPTPPVPPAPVPPVPPVPTPVPTPGPGGVITVIVSGDSINIDPASKTVALPPGWSAGKFHEPMPVPMRPARITSTAGVTYEMGSDGNYWQVIDLWNSGPGTLGTGPTVVPVPPLNFAPFRNVQPMRSLYQNGRVYTQPCTGPNCPLPR